MASEILGLFTSPEEYQMRQQQAQQNRALQFAQLNPFEKASYGIYQGAGQLGQAAGSLFGIEDPQLKKITARQQLLTGTSPMGSNLPALDFTNPVALREAARFALQQNRDPEFAQYLINASYDLEKNMADMRSKTATAAKTELSIAQEEKLRDELSNLGSTPTNEQVLAVVSKYGSPEKIMGVLQATQAARATIEARKEEKAEKFAIEREKIKAKQEADDKEIEARKEAKLLEAKNQKERDAANNQARLERAAAEKRATAQLKATADLLKPPKTLNASLQKEETGNLESIDKADAQLKALNAPIKNLTPDPKTGKPLLELGPLENVFNYGRNVVSLSSEKSRAYEELKSAIDTAVNIKVSDEKGVQTDADVLRQAKALIAAGGGNDSEVTRQALVRFRDAVQKDKENKMKLIESRRKSQGVEPYFPSGESRVVPFSELK
jgi:hypothetical protein